MGEIDITGLDKAEILAALFNSAKTTFFDVGEKLTIKEALKLLKSENKYFDYLRSRVIKTDFTSNTKLESGLYNRDNGQGLMEREVEMIRQRKGGDN